MSFFLNMGGQQFLIMTVEMTICAIVLKNTVSTFTHRVKLSYSYSSTCALKWTFSA